MSIGPVVGRARVETNMSYDSSSLSKIGDRMAAQLSRIGQRNGQIYRNFGRDAVVSWRLALGSIVTSAPWMSAAIGTVSSTLVQAAGAVYSLAQSTFGLYPLVGSLGLAAATAAVGMQNFGNAIAATDPEDLAMYLATLTPSARAAALSVRGLADDYGSLISAAQEPLFEGLASELDKLAYTLFPVLRTNMAEMGGALNGLAHSVLGYVNSAAGLETINGVMSSATSIFEKLSGAVVPFLDGALKLFIALAPAGERLATRITGVAESFQSWTSAEGFGDRIDSMMRRAETTGGLLLQVVGKLGRAFSNVFLAANGPTNDFLQMFIDLLDRFNAWSSSVEGSQAIEKWATDGNRVLAQVGRTIESVFRVLQELSSADALISFLKTIEEAFDLLGRLPLDTMVAKFVEIAELFRPISGPILAFIIAGASLNIMIGNIMGQIGGLVAVLTGLPGNFTRFTSAMSGGATGANRFMGVLKTVGGLLGRVFKFAGVAGIVIWIGSLIAKSDDLKAKLSGVWDAVKGVFTSIGDAFSQIYGSLQPVIAALQPFFDILDKIASLAIGLVLDAITYGIESIGNVISGVGSVVSGFIDMLVGLFTWDPSKMLEGWNTFASGLGPLLSGLWGVLVTFFAPAKLLQLAKAAFMGLGVGIRGAASGIGTAAKGILDTIIKFLSGLPSKVLNLAKTAFTKMENAIFTAGGAVGAAAGRVFTAVINALKALPSKLLSLGKDALSKLGGAISGGIGTVRSAASRVFDGAVNAIKNLPSKLSQFGREAVSKIGSAISGGVGAVRSAATSVANAVKNAVSKLPGEMLNIGKRVVSSIADGIRRGIGKIKDAAGAVARAIRNFLPGSPVNEGPLTAWNTGSSAEGGGRNIVEAITGGLNDIRPIRRAMNDVASAVRFGVTPPTGSFREFAGANAAFAGAGGRSVINISELTLNVDVEDLASVPRIVNTFEGLVLKVRQGVRTSD